MNQGAITKFDGVFKGAMRGNEVAEQLHHFLIANFDRCKTLTDYSQRVEIMEREAFHHRVPPSWNSFGL